jgi:hypothetical protein
VHLGRQLAEAVEIERGSGLAQCRLIPSMEAYPSIQRRLGVAFREQARFPEAVIRTRRRCCARFIRATRLSEDPQ